MLLTNVLIAGTISDAPANIRLRYGSILSVSDSAQKDSIVIDLSGATAYPGFINSHDHLDFNLFPATGNRLYDNYREWGRDIHANNKAEINHILQIPTAIRTLWGMYKNLVNGFTTVVNHGKKLVIDDPFITVYQDAYSLHSTGFEKYWKLKLNVPFHRGRAVAMHIGEGTDSLSHEEINQLKKWNFLQKDIIGIHGVAMNSSQAKDFKALVWCPASNHFLLGETARIDQLKKNTKILFGSDSTLTADWNIWQHLRPALIKNMLTQEELLSTLTLLPAETWGLHDRGSIAAGKRADIVIIQTRPNDTSMINGPDDILLVIHDGIIRLFDESLYTQLVGRCVRIDAFSKIQTGERCKFVFGNLPELAEKTRRVCPSISLPLHIIPEYV